MFLLKLFFIVFILTLRSLLVVKKMKTLIYFSLFQIYQKKLKVIILILKKKFFIFLSQKNTVNWGHLPNLNSKPVASINSTDLVIFDTISHESILEDQGRNPTSFLKTHNVEKNNVLSDSIKIANSNIEHNFFLDGPHIVVGPIHVNEAEPGDILKVDVIDIIPRVNYGFISNRHGKGALPGEYPLGEKPKNRYDFKNISIFAKTYKKNNTWYFLYRR